MVDRVRHVQDFLGAPLALENPSTYVEFSSSSMPEWEFLARVAEEADCALLLDVNNVYVSAFNHGFDPQEYFGSVPFDRVVQLHVAGHTRHETHIVDTHIGPVEEDVWRLLGDAWRRTGGVSVLLEWDAEIPSFEETHAGSAEGEDLHGEGCFNRYAIDVSHVRDRASATLEAKPGPVRAASDAKPVARSEPARDAALRDEQLCSSRALILGP